MPDTEVLIAGGLGFLLGYYVVAHFMVAKKPV